MKHKQAIFLMGPTAAGKTALAIEIAQQLPVDIISVDSAMVYRGLDIGTGKPTVAELEKYPHKLINICEPNEVYSVAQFCVDANAAMQHSWQKNRLPLLVGGTMLYFKALQFGLAQLPEASPELREELSREAQLIGWPAMHARLAAMDPITAQRLKANDSQRIQRALEINILTGQSLNQHFDKQDANIINYDLKSFAIIPERADLHLKIEQRFLQMLDQGLLNEVEKLRSRGDLTVNLPSMRSVGYRQVWEYLDSKLDYKTMTEHAIAATRQLAKRQYTWLRGWPATININNSTAQALDTIVTSVIDSSQH
jgi:tRNA dimethylallyltransferase